MFAGRRNPSRSRLICLCFGLSATLEETQTLLKQCGYAQLYARDRRDAIILYGIVNGMSLFDVNDKLFSEEEETLFLQMQSGHPKTLTYAWIVLSYVLRGT